MAIIIPKDISVDAFHGSLGESKVFTSFKALSDEYSVFHSVAWQQRNKASYISWGEADFVIFHPKRGLIILEVKSGGIKFQLGKWKQINTLTQEESFDPS